MVWIRGVTSQERFYGLHQVAATRGALAEGCIVRGALVAQYPLLIDDKEMWSGLRAIKVDQALIGIEQDQWYAAAPGYLSNQLNGLSRIGYDRPQHRCISPAR